MTALVTGGSRGIGAEIAKALAKDGFDVAICYRNSVERALKVKETIIDYGRKCQIYQVDVSDKKSVISMGKQISQDFGFVDVVVNNAGIAQQKMFCDITEDDWDMMFDVNVKGAYNITQAFLDGMIHNKYGRIINISSMWGISGGSCEVHYSASKAALIGFTKALAKELGPSGITVNCIAPGVIDTEMNSMHDEETMKALADETPVCRIGTTEDVANGVAFLASEKSSFITGQIISIDGGIIL